MAKRTTRVRRVVARARRGAGRAARGMGGLLSGVPGAAIGGFVYAKARPTLSSFTSKIGGVSTPLANGLALYLLAGVVKNPLVKQFAVSGAAVEGYALGQGSGGSAGGSW